MLRGDGRAEVDASCLPPPSAFVFWMQGAHDHTTQPRFFEGTTCGAPSGQCRCVVSSLCGSKRGGAGAVRCCALDHVWTRRVRVRRSADWESCPPLVFLDLRQKMHLFRSHNYQVFPDRHSGETPTIRGISWVRCFPCLLPRRSN